MPPIVFPSSSAPGKDAIESAGRLVNAYAERLQEGAPASYVIRRPPGLTSFCATSETAFRGMWYDGDSYVYAAWEDELFYIDSTGTETSVGALQSARLTYLSSAVDTTNTTAYTYSAVAIGTAHFNRRIVVGVIFDDSGDSPLASLTVGGVAATLVKSQDSAVALYIALVPTGTTADIVVTYATAANRSAIGVWRLDGVTSNTPHHTIGIQGTGTSVGEEIQIPAGGAAVGIASLSSSASMTWTGLTENFDSTVEATRTLSGASLTSVAAQALTASIAYTVGPTATLAMASWGGAPSVSDIVTFAKNNATTPDQVLCTPTLGAFTFTTSALTVLNVNSEVPNSVCYGEGYFFFTTPGGLCYASGLNATTVSSLDVIRAEARPEALYRGIFYDGELYLFGLTHTEVWASGGNPNATGFPLNRTTVIWRGLIAPLAVTGFEEGFEGGLYFVADDNSVRRMNGYQPEIISNPAIERAIEACTDKSNIRAFCYDVDGHACVVIDLAGEATWVLDIMEGGLWHERKTAATSYWRATGNSVKAFGKWLVGDHSTGNIYQVDATSLNDGGSAMPFIAESIAMEAFPQRLQIPRADFNFTSGVGTTAVPNPEVKIQWSDDGGHTWSDPITGKLGENGRYKTQVRKNRLGMTGVKGRRFRLRVDDEVYVGLLAGSMEVAARPS